MNLLEQILRKIFCLHEWGLRSKKFDDDKFRVWTQAAEYHCPKCDKTKPIKL